MECEQIQAQSILLMECEQRGAGLQAQAGLAWPVLRLQQRGAVQRFRWSGHHPHLHSGAGHSSCPAPVRPDPPAGRRERSSQRLGVVPDVSPTALCSSCGIMLLILRGSAILLLWQ